jgi:hypothetical protein
VTDIFSWGFEWKLPKETGIFLAGQMWDIKPRLVQSKCKVHPAILLAFLFAGAVYLLCQFNLDLK